MSKRPQVTAAGGVILREHKGRQQVLLIYRRSYNDWSLPKGKGEPDEYFPETAVREIWEETGVHARLDLRLSTIKYQVSKGLKAVHYWRGSVINSQPRKPDREVERAKWFDIPNALNKITYADERGLIKEAVSRPETVALLLVRHAKAMLRKDWSGPDQKRRLTSRGRRQAEDLIGLFETFGVSRLESSSARRCMDTLAPYAKEFGITTNGIDLFTEEQGTKKPKQVAKHMSDLAAEISEPTAICGHRPVLPSMYAGLNLKPRPMVVGEALVAHLDESGKVIKSEILKPTA